MGKVLTSILLSSELKDLLDRLKREGKITSIAGFLEQAAWEKLRREGLARGRA